MYSNITYRDAEGHRISGVARVKRVATDMLGATIEMAFARAKSSGLKFRIVQRNGMRLEGLDTSNRAKERINVSVRDGLVIGAWPG